MKDPSNNYKEIDDDQERIFYQLSSIYNQKSTNLQKITKQLYELKILQIILFSLIILGIIAFFILILINFHFMIIIIDIGVIILYIAYLKYIKLEIRKIRKISKRENKSISIIKKKNHDLMKWQLIFYSITIIFTITFLIFSMDSIDPWILLIIISFVPIFTFFDNNLDDIKNIKS